ncbi:MAG: hypothetical protein RIS79_3541 [Verrucomicrobiota bacterium]|jgi:hypothetical protein
MRSLLISLFLAQTVTAADLSPQWLVFDQILFADDFSQARGEIKLDRKNAPDAPWQPNQGTRWEVVDGVLRGRASSPEFQAAREHHKGIHPRIVLSKTPEKYVLRFSMRLIDGIPFEAGKRRSIAPFIEIGHHVCRVTWDVNGATLLADGDTTQLANEKDFKLVPGKWETVLIERRDDEVLVQFADGPVFHGKHVSYVTDPHAVMLGGLEAGTMEIDNVTLWSVKDGTQPEWATFAAKLPPQQNLVLRPKTPGRLAAEKKAAEAKSKPN